MFARLTVQPASRRGTPSRARRNTSTAGRVRDEVYESMKAFHSSAWRSGDTVPRALFIRRLYPKHDAVIDRAM
jgi:hypothetical protein